MTDDEPLWLRTVAPAEPDDLDRVVQDVLARWIPIVEAFNQAFADTAQRFARAMVPALARMQRQLEDAGVVVEPLPDDPAERALYLRRHRNTGPAVHADPRRNRR